MTDTAIERAHKKRKGVELGDGTSTTCPHAMRSPSRPGHALQDRPEEVVQSEGRHRATGTSCSSSPALPRGLVFGPTESSHRRAAPSSSTSMAGPSATIRCETQLTSHALVDPGPAAWTRSEAIRIPVPLRTMSMSAKSTASATPVSSNKPQSRIALSQIVRAGGADVRSRGVQTEEEARPPPVLPENIPPLSPARGDPAPPAAYPEFPPSHKRSVEFWYRDGNIIVNAEGTYFQLFLSRLERHCGYFEHASIDRAWTVVNGQKVVEVHDLKVRDFETFLKYLEVPM